MPKQLKWKKVLSGALALTLVTGSGAAVLSAPAAVLAESAAGTSPFVDMPPGHWAEKHISKLYLQGVIDGYRNTVDGTSTFQPERSISQQEAVLMALKFAGLKEAAEAKFPESQTFIFFEDSFVVSTFFKPYIEYAFSEGLLDREEEYALAAEDEEHDWGTKPASREWVTKLIVKAIGQDAVAQQLQYTESHFADSAGISDRYLGYVNAAYQLKLITGKTETTFAPADPVNRASLATLFSRAQYQFPVQYEGQASGVILDVQDASITLYDDGQETTYILDAGTQYYHYNSERPAAKEQLLPYSDVTVIAKDGIAQYVEALGDVQHTASLTGSFLRYVPADNAFYLWIENAPVKFAYDPAVDIADTDGNPVAIGDLKEGTTLTVVQDTFRSEPKPLKLIAEAAQAVTTVQGLFNFVNSNRITVSDNGNYITRDIALGATVEIEGLASPTLNDLIPETDQVELSLDADGKVTKVKVINRDVKILAGAEIWEFNQDKNLIAVTDSFGESYLLTVTDNTKFEYAGTSLDRASAVTLLRTNVNVVISYTHKNVVSVKFVLEYTGTLTSINTRDKELTLLTAEGAAIKLPYTNTVVADFNRRTATHLDLRTGDIVTVLLRMDKVEASAIQVHRVNQFEVVSVDNAKKTIKVKNILNEVFDFPVASATLLRADGSTVTLTGFAAGSKVDITFVGTSVSVVKAVPAASNG